MNEIRFSDSNQVVVEPQSGFIRKELEELSADIAAAQSSAERLTGAIQPILIKPYECETPRSIPSGASELSRTICDAREKISSLKDVLDTAFGRLEL